MTNKARDQVIIEVDGKRLPIRYESNSLAELEDLLETSITELQKNMQLGKVGITEMRAFLYCGLLHLGEFDDLGRCVDPQYTIKECGEFLDTLMQEKDQEAVFEKIGEALMKAMGVDDEDLADVDDQKKINGAGTSSKN